MKKLLFSIKEINYKTYEIPYEEIIETLRNDCNYEGEIPTNFKELIGLLIEEGGLLYLDYDLEGFEDILESVEIIED